MIRLIPPYVLEFLLFAVLIALGALIVRAVRRRWKVAPKTVDALLPDLTTDIRIRATLRRAFRDPDRGVYLLETTVGKRKLTFCALDYETNAAYYTAPSGQGEDFAVYALGTLAPGGADAMRGQIVDLDKVVEPLTDLTRLVQAGQYPNDYAVIGRIVSMREESLHGEPVRVYRTQVEKQDTFQFFIDIAVETGAELPFAADSLVHGSARLFGTRL